MDLLFLLLLGERVNLKVTNRVKLVREFENLISYEESDSIYNNIKLDRNDDTLYNQFVKMIENRINKCKDLKEKFNVENINNFLNNWCKTKYYI